MSANIKVQMCKDDYHLKLFALMDKCKYSKTWTLCVTCHVCVCVYVNYTYECIINLVKNCVELSSVHEEILFIAI